MIILAGRGGGSCSDNDDDSDDDVDDDDDGDDDQTMITMFPGCRGGDSGSARRAENGFEAR